MKFEGTLYKKPVAVNHGILSPSGVPFNYPADLDGVLDFAVPDVGNGIWHYAGNMFGVPSSSIRLSFKGSSWDRTVIFPKRTLLPGEQIPFSIANRDTLVPIVSGFGSNQDALFIYRWNGEDNVEQVAGPIYIPSDSSSVVNPMIFSPGEYWIVGIDHGSTTHFTPVNSFRVVDPLRDLSLEFNGYHVEIPPSSASQEQLDQLALRISFRGYTSPSPTEAFSNLVLQLRCISNPNLPPVIRNLSSIDQIERFNPNSPGSWEIRLDGDILGYPETSIATIWAQ